tara:strand:- start:4059 stop:4334 length:276 start_codon:yes stop_codon:yes gene_type:complete
MSDPYVPIEDIAKHLSVSPSTIRGWVRRGKIPPSTFIKVGNTYRFSIADVVSALRTPVEPTSVEVTVVAEELAMPDEPSVIAFDVNEDEDL